MNMIAFDATPSRTRPVRSADAPASPRGRTPLKVVKAEAAPAPAALDGHEHPLATAHF